MSLFLHDPLGIFVGQELRHRERESLGEKKFNSPSFARMGGCDEEEEAVLLCVPAICV
jgi:hypothetical protein